MGWTQQRWSSSASYYSHKTSHHSTLLFFNYSCNHSSLSSHILHSCKNPKFVINAGSGSSMKINYCFVYIIILHNIFGIHFSSFKLDAHFLGLLLTVKIIFWSWRWLNCIFSDKGSGKVLSKLHWIWSTLEIFIPSQFLRISAKIFFILNHVLGYILKST